MKKKAKDVFRINNLRTKQDWKVYAIQLETLLLLRPSPGSMNKIDQQWIDNYEKWWDDVTDFWTEPTEEDEQDDYGYADQKNFD